MPPKRKSVVDKLLRDDNNQLKIQLHKRNNEMKHLSAEHKRLSRDITTEKATYIELKIKYGQNSPNLNPKVDIERIRLPENAHKTGVRLDPLEYQDYVIDQGRVSQTKESVVDKTLQDENRELKIQLKDKNKEIKHLSAKNKNLSRDLMKQKLTSIEFRMKYERHSLNLNPNVKMQRLSLPGDADKAGIQLNLYPKVIIKKLHIPGLRLKKNTETGDAQTNRAADDHLDSAGPSGCNAQKPNQNSKRPCSDVQLEQSKRQKQTNMICEDNPDDHLDQVLEEDLFLSTSSSGSSSPSENSSVSLSSYTTTSTNINISRTVDKNEHLTVKDDSCSAGGTFSQCQVDNDLSSPKDLVLQCDESPKPDDTSEECSDEELQMDSNGPSVSSETLKPKEYSKRSIPNVQSENSQKEMSSTDTSLTDVQNLDAMLLFDACAFCDGPLPCACRNDD